MSKSFSLRFWGLHQLADLRAHAVDDLLGVPAGAMMPFQPVRLIL